MESTLGGTNYFFLIIISDSVRGCPHIKHTRSTFIFLYQYIGGDVLTRFEYWGGMCPLPIDGFLCLQTISMRTQLQGRTMRTISPLLYMLPPPPLSE